MTGNYFLNFKNQNVPRSAFFEIVKMGLFEEKNDGKILDHKNTEDLNSSENFLKIPEIFLID